MGFLTFQGRRYELRPVLEVVHDLEKIVHQKQWEKWRVPFPDLEHLRAEMESAAKPPRYFAEDLTLLALAACRRPLEREARRAAREVVSQISAGPRIDRKSRRDLADLIAQRVIQLWKRAEG